MHRGILLVLLLASHAVAQESWAERLLDRSKVNFGVVASGSRAEQTLIVHNTLNQPVHISSVTAECQCVVPEQPAHPYLRPGEKTIIRLRLNTADFRRKRDTNLVVTFDEPELTSVRIPVTAYIRSDVIMEPGVVDFGTAPAGTVRKSSVNITYVGRPDWEIRDIRIDSDYLECHLTEKSRRGSDVEYELVATWSADAPPGRIREMVTLVTDDAAHPYIPLYIQGTMEAELEVLNPDTHIAKQIKPGEEVSVRLSVKGRRKFLIDRVIASDNSPVPFKSGSTPNVIQQVAVTMTAPETAGRFQNELRVFIQGRDEPLTARLTGRVTGE